jgi:hypothetical protein
LSARGLDTTHAGSNTSTPSSCDPAPVAVWSHCSTRPAGIGMSSTALSRSQHLLVGLECALDTDTSVQMLAHEVDTSTRIGRAIPEPLKVRDGDTTGVCEDVRHNRNILPARWFQVESHPFRHVHHGLCRQAGYRSSSPATDQMLCSHVPTIPCARARAGSPLE